jgi:Tol biopolymer transport system component/DNA-binding CsgD family transcriptional regulator
LRKQKARKDQGREADMLTPRERGVLSLMREGLNDDQIAERLGIDVATAQYDIWGILSKLGLESRAQVAVARPPDQPPAPDMEAEPGEPEPDGSAASGPEAPRRRMDLRLAAQIFGIVLALLGLGLIVWGIRMAADNDGGRSLVVRTALPTQATVAATNPPSTITPFPTVVPEEPVLAFGQFGFRRSLYSIRPDGSEFYALLPSPPRAYAWSPDATQLAYVQAYGDIDLKFISAAGEALRSVRLEGVFNVEGITWPDEGSRVVLSVQVPQPSDPSTLKNTIALLELQGGPLTILDSAPLLPNGLITLPGGTPTAVPHPNSGAALSPDGAYVAWPSGDGRILIQPVNGETPPAVVAGRLPAWSADSGRLAFQAGADIHIAARDGSGEEVLAPGGQPAWAPAASISFIRDGNLFVIDPDTGEETQLTEIDLPFASNPRWSPDGARILFGYAASVSEIFTVGSNGEERTLLVPGSYPQWSPDGESIAFAAGNGKGNLFLMSPDGSDLTALPATISLSDPAPPDAGCHARPFQWSPAGDRLAVCNARSGNIDIIRFSGEGPILVGSGSSFSWSPDGARIAFTGYGGEGAASRALVYIADPAQPNAPPQPLAEGTTPDWSPDGERIAYVANDGLHVASANTGESTLVAAGDIARSHISWSPDSTRLTYVSAGRIFIATLTSPDAPIAITEGLNPQWSPDGTQIAYYTSAPNGHEDLWAVPADASAPPRHLGKGRSPTWSPDSARLAYHRFIP